MTSRETARTWTLLPLLQWATTHLSERGFDEARLHVELLLAHVLHLSRVQLYTNYDRPLNPEELSAFRELFRRRLRHEPLQYILGTAEFMGLELIVDNNVLIPRPETELLVESVAAYMKERSQPDLQVLDIGTGSGNIPVALAKVFPDARFTAIDISEEALAVARRNLARHSITTVLLHPWDLFSGSLPGTAFDVIVSNPPYISAEDFDHLPPEIRDFEPKIATTDGGDGYGVIRKVAETAAEHLADRGAVFVEIAYGQAEAVKMIFTAAGFPTIGVQKDFSGIPRVVRAERI